VASAVSAAKHLPEIIAARNIRQRAP